METIEKVAMEFNWRESVLSCGLFHMSHPADSCSVKLE